MGLKDWYRVPQNPVAHHVPYKDRNDGGGVYRIPISDPKRLNGEIHGNTMLCH